MRLVSAAEAKASSLASLKMDERKRAALDDNTGSAPALKRQATSTNGITAHPDTDMYWKEDIERYQKDAILRQMREYKREKNNLEAELARMAKQSTYHDDHLRLIDSWFSQLLDEMTVLANSLDLPSTSNHAPFKSSLFSANNNDFEDYLKQRSKDIKHTTTLLFSKFPVSSPDVRELQEKLTGLLAAEKAHTVELQRLESEKEQLSDRLENASYRYMVAEKKLDRTKSAQVAKLEAQASSAPRPDGTGSDSPTVKKEEGGSQAQVSEDNASGQEAEIARKEAVAVADTRAKQLDALQLENKRLTEDLTETRMRLTGLTDEDYAGSELFKLVRSQHDDVVKRVNDLEALNIQLRAEAKQLQAERTSYREEADNELRAATIEMESQLARSEADLARIRHARDELVADLGIRKASSDTNKASATQTHELACAKDARLETLELEIERLRASLAKDDTDGATEHYAELSPTAVKSRLAAVEKDKGMLETELRSMESAYKKASAAASKRIAETTEAEERMNRLAADKAKADQKFFAVMKAKETREIETKTLRTQNTKSTEIVSQLKDAESSNRALLANYEKQLAEAKDNIIVVTNHGRVAQQNLAEQKISLDRLAGQVEELKKLVAEKDSTTSAAAQAQRKAEASVSELQARLEETEKNLEVMRKRSSGNQSEEYEMLRTIAICTVCRKNFKNTVIKNCGHVFCQSCVDERISARSRKCPNCGKAFGNGDHMRVTL